MKKDRQKFRPIAMIKLKENEEKQKCEMKKTADLFTLAPKETASAKKYVFLDEINHHTGYIFSILRIASVSFNMYSARMACDLVYDFFFACLRYYPFTHSSYMLKTYVMFIFLFLEKKNHAY